MTAHSHPIEEAGDWIEWSGGECPIASDETAFDVRLRTGKEYCVETGASGLRWSHRGKSSGDIIAFRIIRS